jgi:hypothetical protein
MSTIPHNSSQATKEQRLQTIYICAQPVIFAYLECERTQPPHNPFAICCDSMNQGREMIWFCWMGQNVSFKMTIKTGKSKFAIFGSENQAGKG